MGQHNPSIEELLIVSIIVYRISTDFAEMDGPFNLFSRLRGAAMYNEHVSDWVVEGLNCAVCVSFWVACTIVLWTGDWRYFCAAGVTRLIIDWRNRK